MLLTLSHDIICHCSSFINNKCGFFLKEYLIKHTPSLFLGIIRHSFLQIWEYIYIIDLSKQAVKVHDNSLFTGQPFVQIFTMRKMNSLLQISIPSHCIDLFSKLCTLKRHNFFYMIEFEASQIPRNARVFRVNKRICIDEQQIDSMSGFSFKKRQGNFFSPKKILH